MKRLISIIAIICLVLACGALFSSCKDDDKDQSVQKITATDENDKDANVEESADDVVETYTVIIDSTDKEGNEQSSVVEYSVKGGSDPYVEDIF